MKTRIRFKFLILLLVLIVLWSNLPAQEVKLKTEDRDKYYEEYYVLATDKKVKHGSYLKFTKPLEGLLGTVHFSAVGSYFKGKKHGLWEEYYPACNQIAYRGFYHQGMKDSLWVSYFREPGIKELKEVQTTAGQSIEIVDLNNKIISLGKYKNNIKVGVWEFYDVNQILIQQYDYDKDSLLYDASIPDPANKAVSFIGGDDHREKTFYELFELKNIMERIHNKLGLEAGRISISFLLTPEGEVTDVMLVKDEIGNKKFLKQALEFVQQLEGCWSPKFLEGSPVCSKVVMNFILGIEYATVVNSSGVGSWMSAQTSMKYNFKIEME